jgi:hypothetical protein
MAKVTITIEDKPDGKVNTVCEPSFEIMMQMLTSGHQLTSAQGYAVHCLNALRHASQKMQGQSDIITVSVPVIT